MPSPRKIAEQKNSDLKTPAYCGVCGVPLPCTCGQYKEFGVEGATRAGSANTDDETPTKFGGGGKAPPFGKKEGGGKAPPSGEKKDGGGKAPPFGKKDEKE